MPHPVDDAGPLAALSKRERLVAAKFAEGLTYREIGDALCLAPSTVRTHLAAIYDKLGIRSKAALAYLVADHRALARQQNQARAGAWSPAGAVCVRPPNTAAPPGSGRADGVGSSARLDRGRLPLADAVPLRERPAADGRPSRLAPRGLARGAERRQVVVLSAGLCACAQLGEELDPELLHALLGRFFECVGGIVEAHGATAEKVAGDSVMAVFGAPVARGNDAERAVRAAFAVRDAVPEIGRAISRALGARIGVAAGIAVAGHTGSAARCAYLVTGRSADLAPRLAERAAAGEILASDEVRAALEERLEADDLGGGVADGSARPVRVWRLRALRERGNAARLPFVGRRGELRQLLAALDGCRATGRGTTIYVRGEAGIGKTRLVEEFARRAEARGFGCHTALVLDFGAGRDAVRALVRELLGLAADSDGASRAAAAEAAPARGMVSADHRAHLNDLLDLPQPAELRALYDAMDIASRNHGKRETVAELVRSAAAARPRFLLVEDLHWADRATLDHLASLRAAVADCPAVLILTTRIEDDPLDATWRAGAWGSPFLTFDLGALHEAEASALARSHCRATDEFVQRCVARAAGNPLFLEQLLRCAEESAETGVPASVQSLVQARLDRLDPADKRALQAASVFGQRFAGAALGHLLEQPDYDFSQLVAHLLVRPQGEEFLFAHALIRDAVYDTLLKGRRRELHRRAAGWFTERDRVLQAEHLERAEDPAAPRAYLEAARAQAAEYRHDMACRLVERGLALAADPGDRFGLTCFQGDILHDLGAMPEARRAYEAALAATRDDAGRSQAWLGLAAVKRITDDLDGALADLERAEAAALAHGLAEESARVHFLRGNLYFPRGDIDGCLREHGKSLELARRVGAANLEAAALGGVGDAEFVRGRMISAHESLRDCVELCRRHGFGRIEVANLAQIAHAKLYSRTQREALEEAQVAARAAARVGHLRAEMTARLAASYASAALLELERCLSEIAKARALVRRLGAWRFEQPCLQHLARIALLEGRRGDAVEALREAEVVGRRVGIGIYSASTQADLALALVIPDERRRALAEGEALVRTGHAGYNRLRFYPHAMETALELGDFDEVERYAAALEDYTRPEPLPWSDFFIARGRALAAFGRGRRDAALLAELERLRREAGRSGLRIALPAIEGALAVTSPG